MVTEPTQNVSAGSDITGLEKGMRIDAQPFRFRFKNAQVRDEFLEQVAAQL
jgi:hypothetical protein